jgi:hypothetical protein
MRAKFKCAFNGCDFKHIHLKQLKLHHTSAHNTAWKPVAATDVRRPLTGPTESIAHLLTCKAAERFREEAGIAIPTRSERHSGHEHHFHFETIDTGKLLKFFKLIVDYLYDTTDVP